MPKRKSDRRRAQRSKRSRPEPTCDVDVWEVLVLDDGEECPWCAALGIHVDDDGSVHAVCANEERPPFAAEAPQAVNRSQRKGHQ
jgi:hypothetical protein